MCQIRHSPQELLSFKFSPAKYCGVAISKIIFLIWTSLLLQSREAGATYREHFVHNDRICPNPLHLHEEFPKDTLVVSLPKKLPLFGPVSDFPCNFASTSAGGVKKVIVRAIHPNRYLWDYSRAKSCDYFIKFKRSDMQQTNVHSKKDVICRVLKKEDDSYHQGSFYHPMMWNSPDHKMTLSFSTYDWEYTLGNNTTTTLYKPVYLQMVFLVYADDNKYCSLRVQQYLIDPLKSINNSCSWNFQHCGQYDCSEAKMLLENIGFRTYEVDELEYERRKHNNGSIDSNETNSMSGKPNNWTDHNHGSFTIHRSKATEETDRPTSTLNEFDIHTTGTVTYYNNSNSVTNSFHSYAVTSIIVVPIVVLIVAVIAINRCNSISRSRNGYRTYESHESLIVPLNRHPVIMNTHVSEDGNVILGEVLPSHRFWSRDYSMDYIQPVDLRSIHMSLGGSKTTISAPPSYETLGPPRYSDAIVI